MTTHKILVEERYLSNPNIEIVEEPNKKEIIKLNAKVLYLLDNPALEKVFHPFFDILEKELSINNKESFYKNIDYDILLDIFNGYEFKLEKKTDFYEKVDKLIHLSNHTLHSSPQNITKVLIHQYKNYHGKYDDLKNDQEYVDVMYKVAEKMINPYYINILVHGTHQILNDQDNETYIDIIKHTQFKQPFAKMIACLIKINKSQYQISKNNQNRYIQIKNAIILSKYRINNILGLNLNNYNKIYNNF